MYCVFKKNKFVGYTDDKNIAAEIKKTRSKKYRIERMKGYLANEDLFRHEFFIHPLHQIPITENEYNQAISDALSYFVSIKEIIDEILSLSYYIKFSDEELASMALFINDIRYMIGDIEREDPSIYIEDYINMDIVISEIL